MAMLARYAEALCSDARQVAPAPEPLAPPDLPPGNGNLDEHESKRVLSAFGISSTRDYMLPIGADPSSLADTLTYPVAVKIVSRAIAHKTEIGGVKLNVSNAAELSIAIAEVVQRGRRAAADERISGVLISERVSDGLETIVGVVNDASFGPVVAFGSAPLIAGPADARAGRLHPLRPMGYLFVILADSATHHSWARRPRRSSTSAALDRQPRP